MLNFDNTDQHEALNKVISDLLKDLDRMDSTADGFGGAIDNLVKLAKVKNETLKTEAELLHEEQKLNLDAAKITSEQDKIGVEREKLEFESQKLEFEKEKNRSWRPSPDAIVTGAASILGIVAILHYEKLGVITSKALSFVGKARN